MPSRTPVSFCSPTRTSRAPRRTVSDRSDLQFATTCCFTYSTAICFSFVFCYFQRLLFIRTSLLFCFPPFSFVCLSQKICSLSVRSLSAFCVKCTNCIPVSTFKALRMVGHRTKLVGLTGRLLEAVYCLSFNLITTPEPIRILTSDATVRKFMRLVLRVCFVCASLDHRH